MKIKHLPALAALVAVPLLSIAAPAVAHEGSHPFKNCTDAKANGYSNIPSSDGQHYAKKLDRDGDGYGCDTHGTLANDGKDATGHYAAKDDKAADDKALAETGGDSRTPIIAAAGGALLLGGGAMAFRRKRQH